MSTADQNPGPGTDPGASPWDIPTAAPTTSAPGGHLPAFGQPAAPVPPREETPGQGRAASGASGPPFQAGTPAAVSFPQPPQEPPREPQHPQWQGQASQAGSVPPFMTAGAQQGSPFGETDAQQEHSFPQPPQGSPFAQPQPGVVPPFPAGPAGFGAPSFSAPTPGAPAGPGFTQFPGTHAEPESLMTQVPLPPSMQSPYGAPLQQPRLLLTPQGGDGPDGSDPEASAKRRKTILVSSLAAVAVVGVGAAVALLGGGSPQKDTSLAGTSQDSVSNPFGGQAGSSSGKPDGDTQAGAMQAGGALPTDPSGAAVPGATSVPGQPVPSGSATTKPAGAASHTAGGATTTAGARPATVAGSSAPHSSAPGTTAKPPTTTAPKPPVTTTAAPPSTDCTYLNLPAAQMPVISQGSPGSANAVKQLQCLMKKSELGIKPLVIDGVWGPDTQSALIAFKQCNNAPTVQSPGGNPPYARLTVDGTVGQQTWADLYFWDNQYFNRVAYYCNGTR